MLLLIIEHSKMVTFNSVMVKTNPLLKHIFFRCKLLVIFIVLSTSCSSLRMHKTKLPSTNILVDLSGGYNYDNGLHSFGGFEINEKHLDIYSSQKHPILIEMALEQNTNLIIITDAKGNKFILKKGTGDNSIYCPIALEEGDQLRLGSSITLFPHFAGLDILGGTPMFKRFRFYTLTIKKKNGDRFKAVWKFTTYKSRNSIDHSWSGDMDDGHGEGLIKLKIRNSK